METETQTLIMIIIVSILVIGILFSVCKSLISEIKLIKNEPSLRRWIVIFGYVSAVVCALSFLYILTEEAFNVSISLQGLIIRHVTRTSFLLSYLLFIISFIIKLFQERKLNKKSLKERKS